jgi:DNA-binding GntR family transcriptional regulator
MTALKGKRGDTVDLVASQIRQQIAIGALAPGQRLIARNLIDQLKISRSTIREAFGRLAADGLVVLVPNQGAMVRKFSADELRALFQIREVLEGLGAALAAENIRSGDNRQAFVQIIEDTVETSDETQTKFLERNYRFHQTIAALSGNSLLEEMLGRLKLPLVMIQMRQAMGQSHIAESTSEHQEIAHWILAGEPIKAEAAMRHHLQRSATLLVIDEINLSRI